MTDESESTISSQSDTERGTIMTRRGDELQDTLETTCDKKAAFTRARWFIVSATASSLKAARKTFVRARHVRRHSRGFPSNRNLIWRRANDIRPLPSSAHRTYCNLTLRQCCAAGTSGTTRKDSMDCSAEWLESFIRILKVFKEETGRKKKYIFS